MSSRFLVYERREVDQGFHGEMGYRRRVPRALLPIASCADIYTRAQLDSAGFIAIISSAVVSDVIFQMNAELLRLICRREWYSRIRWNQADIYSIAATLGSLGSVEMTEAVERSEFARRSIVMAVIYMHTDYLKHFATRVAVDSGLIVMAPSKVGSPEYLAFIDRAFSVHIYEWAWALPASVSKMDWEQVAWILTKLHHVGLSLTYWFRSYGVIRAMVSPLLSDEVSAWVWDDDPTGG